MLLYAMSRGALQGGRELRLRVRHKKPKRLLRSWYNLLGQDQGSVNGSDELEEVQKDTKHRANHHESKEMACKQLPTSAPPAVGAEHLYSGRTRLNGSSNHGAALLDKILNGRCHSQPEPSAGKDVVPTFEDEEDDEIEQDSDLVCSVCNGGQSDPPNEIVICDTCNKGFHQACHTPKIGDQVLLPNIPWHCRNCVPVGSVRKSAKNYRNGAPVQMFKLGFPYNMKSLQWDSQHRVNTRNCYCYCGGPGVWNKKMLQCRLCQQWFHEACIQGLETPLLYGDSFYYFSCSVCNNGPEVVKRMPLCWMDITHLTLYNLVMEHHKKYYELDEEIMPYLNSIWLALQLPSEIFRCSMRERRLNIYECLYGDSSRFKSGKEVKKRTSLWSLRDRCEPPDPRRATALLRENKNSNVMPARSAKDPVSAPSGEALFRKGPGRGMLVLPGRENGQIKRRRRKAHDIPQKGANAAGKANIGQSRKQVLGRLPSGKAQPVPNGIAPDPSASDDDESSSSCSTAVSSTFLDSFIPVPDDFEGGNNPFRLLEASPPPPVLPPRPRPGRPRKPKPPPDKVPSEAKQQQPPRLKPNQVDTLKPAQSRRNSRKVTSCRDSHRIPKLQDSRTVTLAPSDSDSDSSGSSSTSTTSTSTSSSSSGSSSITTEERDVMKVTAPQRWKSALRSGEKCDTSKRFSVLAKRVGVDGKIQYLVEWDGASSRS
ncbi:metal-response element-binding transcription factor 2 isoform X3 [Ixodes scapularis]|uniref:metal-response element-binding transcription factor 2 isoform X3 n=1 Tax=Ixodes scapularis TaxID=6945 RepID=UPI001C3833E9|nr:metal-response element-binding transcription factor 2 isoform X3 [Ixodes scapularis]